jgi:Domain of unknown function (DUF4124)
MAMNKLLLTAGLAICIPIGQAQSAGQALATTIYKLVDDSGKVTYSNLPMKGAVKVELDPITTMPLPGPAARPAAATKISLATQSLSSLDALSQKRGDIRRKILEDEMRNEEKLLVEAKSAFQEEDGNRTVIHMMRAAAEKQSPAASVDARRAYDQREEKLKTMQDTIATHEKNVEAIRKELAALK